MVSDPDDPTRPLFFGTNRPSVVTITGVTLTVEEGPDTGQLFRSTAPVITVGKGRANDFVLTDLTVSRSHLLLRVSGEGVLVEDLKTKNGTWIAGARILSALVPDGGRVTIGESVLRVDFAPEKLTISSNDRGVFHGMLTSMDSMRQVFDLVSNLAQHDVPVSITGETGTGKELIARALHDAGPRRSRRYQVLDCGSVVPELLASELFGHEKGAFTGADQTTKGIFEQAEGGTVFLDEIGELDLSVQTHLLRVLETRQVQKLGSRESVPVVFRLVSATHRDLRKFVQEGKFRQDLFYRVSGLTISLPSLRERTADIPLLTKHFLTDCAARNHLAVPELTDEALRLLVSHPWPGNIRELRHAADALCVMVTGNPILGRHVEKVLNPLSSSQPDLKRPEVEPAPSVPPSNPGNVDHNLERMERQVILDALNACRWNHSLTAEKLGISRSSLYTRMKRFAIRRNSSE